MRTRVDRILVLFVVVILATGFPGRAATAEAADPGSRIAGIVFGADGKTPEAGARVLAYHLFTERTFESALTDSRGRYELTGLPQGYFDIAVRAGQGLYVIEQVVGVTEHGEAALSLVVGPAQAGASSSARRFAGLEEPVTGIAAVRQRADGGSFFRSKSGLALVGVGVLGLAALGGSGSGGASDSSPSEP